MEKLSSFQDTTGGSASPDAVQRGVDSAGTAMHSSIDKVADPARRTVDRLSSAAHETVDKFANTARQTANRFSDQTRRMTEAPGRALEYSKSWVHDKPLEAVGAALAVGFVLGWVSARR